jgi:hypothetical protein
MTIPRLPKPMTPDEDDSEMPGWAIIFIIVIAILFVAIAIALTIQAWR